jgi:chromosome segregation ATPase
MNAQKLISLILAVAVVGLAIVFYKAQQTAKQEIATAEQHLSKTQAELAATQSALATTKGHATQLTESLTAVTNELVLVTQQANEAKSVAQAKTEEATQLHATVTRLETEKSSVESQLKLANERAAELSRNLETARTEIQQKESTVDSLEKTKANLDAQLAELNKQLAAVQKSLANLESEHTTTIGHLKAMREDYVKLTREKEDLEAKMNDLDALRAQVREVKRAMHEAKVAEQRRLDRIETTMGNSGFLMKQGAWQTDRQPGKYPLTSDIKRDE